MRSVVHTRVGRSLAVSTWRVVKDVGEDFAAMVGSNLPSNGGLRVMQHLPTLTSILSPRPNVSETPTILIVVVHDKHRFAVWEHCSGSCKSDRTERSWRWQPRRLC